MFVYVCVKWLQKIKQMDIDNWQNVRGPRPWEENVGAAENRS